jgi:MoxR-like ATPase
MTAAPPRLVGRDQPLAELQALVAAALASRGGLVTLTGEAGIGKTAVAAAAADHAEALGAAIVPLVQEYVAGHDGVGPDEAAAWAAEQAEPGERGEFYFACTQFCFTATAA